MFTEGEEEHQGRAVAAVRLIIRSRQVAKRVQQSSISTERLRKACEQTEGLSSLPSGGWMRSLHVTWGPFLSDAPTLLWSSPLVGQTAPCVTFFCRLCSWLQTWLFYLSCSSVSMLWTPEPKKHQSSTRRQKPSPMSLQRYLLFFVNVRNVLHDITDIIF